MDAAHDALYGLIEVGAADRGVALDETGAQLRDLCVVGGLLLVQQLDELAVMLGGQFPGEVVPLNARLALRDPGGLPLGLGQALGGDVPVGEDPLDGFPDPADELSWLRLELVEDRRLDGVGGIGGMSQDVSASRSRRVQQ